MSRDQFVFGWSATRASLYWHGRFPRFSALGLSGMACGKSLSEGQIAVQERNYLHKIVPVVRNGSLHARLGSRDSHELSQDLFDSEHVSTHSFLFPTLSTGS